MATTKTDPLAGIPVATASPAKVSAPVATGVINLAAAKKKRKLTGQDRKDAVKFARDMVGYDNTSPIWGKRLIVVLAEISDQLTQARADARTSPALAETSIDGALQWVGELQKRVAFGQVMKAQS